MTGGVHGFPMRRSKTERGRCSALRNADAVVRLLREEDIDTLSREYDVTTATISGWRDHFLAGGQATLKMPFWPPRVKPGSNILCLALRLISRR